MGLSAKKPRDRGGAPPFLSPRRGSTAIVRPPPPREQDGLPTTLLVWVLDFQTVQLIPHRILQNSHSHRDRHPDPPTNIKQSLGLICTCSCEPDTDANMSSHTQKICEREREKSPSPLRERNSTERSLSFLPFGKVADIWREDWSEQVQGRKIKVRGQRRLSEDQRHRIQGPRGPPSSAGEQKTPASREEEAKQLLTPSWEGLVALASSCVTYAVTPTFSPGHSSEEAPVSAACHASLCPCEGCWAF